MGVKPYAKRVAHYRIPEFIRAVLHTWQLPTNRSYHILLATRDLIAHISVDSTELMHVFP